MRREYFTVADHRSRADRMRKRVQARQFLNNAAPMQVETCRRMENGAALRLIVA